VLARQADLGVEARRRRRDGLGLQRREPRHARPQARHGVGIAGARVGEQPLRPARVGRRRRSADPADRTDWSDALRRLRFGGVLERRP